MQSCDHHLGMYVNCMYMYLGIPPSGFLVRHSPARAMASVTSSRRPVPTNAFTQCFSLPPHSFPHVDATERGFSARRMHRFSCPVGAHTYTGCSTLTTTSPRASACTADICKRDNREWVPAWCMPRCLPGLPAFFGRHWRAHSFCGQLGSSSSSRQFVGVALPPSRLFRVRRRCPRPILPRAVFLLPTPARWGVSLVRAPI
jgi:hypothetical protein